uniref:Mitochondrial Carrier (MC) Family n=1 Tax=Hyaloperonospora arabidopsidis (strain Emoy2) TaxID=559515 RepID=M4B616_HYAAE
MESFMSDRGADGRSEATSPLPRQQQTATHLFARFPHVREVFCGGTAAAINIVVTFPPNKVMFRQQLFGLNTWQAFDNVRSEGWTMLYRGVKPPLVQAMVSKSIMFGLYNFYDDMLVQSFGERPGLNLIAAAMAGTSEAVLAPFERAQTLLQTPKFNREIAGAYDAMVHVNKYGLREHYRGLSAILCRNGPGNILFFGLRGPLRQLFPIGETTAATMTNDFICGAMLGAIISTFTFPINVARTRMQSVYGQPFIGPWEALQLTYQERGHSVRKLYRGVQVNFFRSLLSWGIINSTYEKLKSIT